MMMTKLACRYLEQVHGIADDQEGWWFGCFGQEVSNGGVWRRQELGVETETLQRLSQDLRYLVLQQRVIAGAAE